MKLYCALAWKKVFFAASLVLHIGRSGEILINGVLLPMLGIGSIYVLENYKNTCVLSLWKVSNGNFYKRGSDVITHSTHSYSFFAHSCSFLLILHDACAEGFVFILLNACAEKVYTYIQQILQQLSTFHCFLF